MRVRRADRVVEHGTYGEIGTCVRTGRSEWTATANDGKVYRRRSQASALLALSSHERRARKPPDPTPWKARP